MTFYLNRTLECHIHFCRNYNFHKNCFCLYKLYILFLNLGDSDDRARLEKMTEREREEELFKRAETREAEKKRFEIQKKLKKEHKLKVRLINLFFSKDPKQ